MTCGIYCITNNINGKQYVGQSVDIEERFWQHINGKNESEIHKAIIEYGVHNFRFEPLIECSPNELDEQEVKFIRLLGTYENGYNQTRGGQHSVFNIEHNYEKYSELKQQVKNKQKRIVALKNENKKLENEINGLYNQIRNLKDKNDSLTTNNIYLKKTIKQLKNNTIKSLRETITDLKKGDATLFKKEIRSLRNKIKSLETKNERLKSENVELKFDNERMVKNYVNKNGVPENNIFQKILVEQETGVMK